MSSTIGMFTTPRVIRSVVLTASGPNPQKYVLVGLAGATSAGLFSFVMTLASDEACFQSNVATYLYSCSIVSKNCAASVSIPNVKNKSSYPLVGTQNILFVVVGALLAVPDFF